MRYSRRKVNQTVRIVTLAVLLVIFAVSYLKNQNSKPKDIENKFETDDYVCFFDVGQGDCALVSSNGKNCLIDTGTGEGVKPLIEKLTAQNVRNIDVLNISHYHADHTGGLLDIVKAFSVENLLFPREFPDTNVSNRVDLAKRECLAADGEYYTAKKGSKIYIGDFTLEVLYQNQNTDDENNRSVYIMAEMENRKFLFTGDAGKESEEKLIKTAKIKCDVLKSPHHGSSYSSADEFLDKADPDYAVISCGEGNSYGHPHKETLENYDARNIKTYRTDVNGDVTFFVKDKDLSVKVEK